MKQLLVVPAGTEIGFNGIHDALKPFSPRFSEMRTGQSYVGFWEVIDASQKIEEIRKQARGSRVYNIA